jgi:hypothetical protein
MWKKLILPVSMILMLLTAEASAGLKCGDRLKVRTYSGIISMGELTRTRYDYFEITGSDSVVVRIMADSLDTVWLRSNRAIEGAIAGFASGIIVGEILRDKDAETRFTTFAAAGIGAALGTFVGFHLKTWEEIDMDWELDCFPDDLAFAPRISLKLGFNL